MREDSLDSKVRELSNWKRWGDADELGTLNHISPQHRVWAAHQVSSGIVVSCTRPIPDPATVAEGKVQRRILRGGSEAPATGYGFAEDWFGLHVHGHSLTHLDAPAHAFWNGAMYNGRAADMVSINDGAMANAVTAAAGGIVGRGLLLDVAESTPEGWLPPGHAVTVRDLEACEQRQGLECGTGDIVFIRFGRDRRAELHGPLRPGEEGNPGLDQECVAWFADRQIALFGTDVVAESRSPDQPVRPAVHVLSLVALGLWMIDNLALEQLAQVCQHEQRWQYLAMIAPLALSAATGSPVNPLAVF